MGILDLLVLAKLVPSKGEGRRLVTQGGISIDSSKVTDAAFTVGLDLFKDGQIIIKKGKKVFHKIILK